MEHFKLLADENITGAVIDQLARQGIEIRRVSQVLPEGAPDPDVLEYAFENGYALLTHVERITRHIARRSDAGNEQNGVFIAGHHLQGERGIGAIVSFVLEYYDLIAGGAASE